MDVAPSPDTMSAPLPGPLPPDLVRLVLARLPCAAVAALTGRGGAAKPLYSSVRTDYRL